MEKMLQKKQTLAMLMKVRQKLHKRNSKISNIQDVILAGAYLIELGAKNVLIKGGHLNYKNIRDVFMNKKEITIFKNKKIKKHECNRNNT